MNNESNQVSNARENRLHELLETTGTAATGVLEISMLKKRVERAVEDALNEAERSIKHGKHTFEDAVDDATYLIKKNPWQSVGYTAGAGLCLGLISGWLLTRRGNKVH